MGGISGVFFAKEPREARVAWQPGNVQNRIQLVTRQCSSADGGCFPLDSRNSMWRINIQVSVLPLKSKNWFARLCWTTRWRSIVSPSWIPFQLSSTLWEFMQQGFKFMYGNWFSSCFCWALYVVLLGLVVSRGLWSWFSWSHVQSRLWYKSAMHFTPATSGRSCSPFCNVPFFVFFCKSFFYRRK